LLGAVRSCTVADTGVADVIRRLSPLPLEQLASIDRPVRLDDLRLPSQARILVLAPHPDDFDSIAVTLKRRLDAGQAVDLVVLTGGAAGVLDSFLSMPTVRDKDDVREEEQKNALVYFGLPPANAAFPRLAVDADGELLVDDECRRAVASIIRDADPDVVFTSHGEDTNSGHRRACALFREIAATTTKPLLALYNRDPKTVRIRLDLYTAFGPEEATWKRGLLRHHRSQQARNLETRGSGFDDRILAVNAAMARELGAEDGFAEGFQMELFLPQGE
jgi:LmbE family N-acetylglucosaminyl deacetylase